MSHAKHTGSAAKDPLQQPHYQMLKDLERKPNQLTEEDILRAWDIISPAGRSILTKSQMLDQLQLFFPHISAREVKELVGTGNMSLDKLRELLMANKEMAQEVDADREAFRVLDPHGTGYVEVNVLRKLMLQLHGVDYLDKADIALLERLVDFDNDGRMSLRDFMHLGTWIPPRDDTLEQRTVDPRNMK